MSGRTAKYADTPQYKAWHAVTQGDIKSLDAVLREHGSTATRVAQVGRGQGETPLSAAAGAGDSAGVERLLAAGAEPNTTSRDHPVVSPLARATASGSLTTVRMLLDAEAAASDNEDVQDIAVGHGDPAAEPANRILELLLDRLPPSGTALSRCVERHAPHWAAQLTARGIDPNRIWKPWSGPPLVLAFDAPGNINKKSIGPHLVQVLLDADADPNAATGHEGVDSPPMLVAAIERGAWWAIEPLADAGARIAEASGWIQSWGLRTAETDSGQAQALTRLVRLMDTRLG